MMAPAIYLYRLRDARTELDNLGTSSLTTITLDVQRPILSRLPTMHTLRRWPSLLFDFVQRPIVVAAR